MELIDGKRIASEIKAEEMQKLVSETVRTFLSEEKQGNK